MVRSVLLAETSSEKRRPTGLKIFKELKNQVQALKWGADCIEKIADASRKRTKVVQNMSEL